MNGSKWKEIGDVKQNTRESKICTAPKLMGMIKMNGVYTGSFYIVKNYIFSMQEILEKA